MTVKECIINLPSNAVVSSNSGGQNQAECDRVNQLKLIEAKVRKLVQESIEGASELDAEIKCSHRNYTKYYRDSFPDYLADLASYTNREKSIALVAITSRKKMLNVEELFRGVTLAFPELEGKFSDLECQCLSLAHKYDDMEEDLKATEDSKVPSTRALTIQEMYYRDYGCELPRSLLPLNQDEGRGATSDSEGLAFDPGLYPAFPGEAAIDDELQSQETIHEVHAALGNDNYFPNIDFSAFDSISHQLDP